MATFKNITVKMANGKTRTQRAMVLANGRYKFVKKGAGKAAPRKRSKSMAKRKKSSTALARRSRRRYHLAKMPRRRRSSRRGTGINMVHLGAATLGLAYLTGAASPIKQIPTMAAKIPGAKTFGAPAVVGVTALAVNHFRPNKWLKLLGAAGIVLAAARVGEKGSSFSWVGDDDDVADFDDDVGDDDDVADYEDDAA
jgi:hypothetical protein